MNSASTTKKEESTLVCFNIHGEKYAIDVAKVKEVSPMVDITPVPGTSKSTLGVINLRGNVISVLDINLILNPNNSNKSNNGEKKILIIEYFEHEVGLLVDAVFDVLKAKNLAYESSTNSEEIKAKQYISGITNVNDNLLVLLDIDKLITDNL